MFRGNLIALATLCHIARLGTFQAAAEHMNTTQPAISARIRELESQLGIVLFQKRGRRMELTMQARDLVHRIEPLLFAVDEVLLSVENPTAATGLVRIGISEMTGFTWFPTFIEAARQHMPRLAYEVDVDLTINTRQSLENGKLDLVFVAEALDHSRFHTEPVGFMKIAWVGTPIVHAGPDTERLASWESRIQRERVWSLSPTSALHSLLLSAIDKPKKIKANIDICNNVLTVAQLVAAGTGIALLPTGIIEDKLRTGALVQLSGAPPVPSLAIYAAWHRDQNQTIIRKLVDLAAATTTFISTP